jgi:hypothetical protein
VPLLDDLDKRSGTYRQYHQHQYRVIASKVTKEIVFGRVTGSRQYFVRRFCPSVFSTGRRIRTASLISYIFESFGWSWRLKTGAGCFPGNFGSVNDTATTPAGVQEYSVVEYYFMTAG